MDLVQEVSFLERNPYLEEVYHQSQEEEAFHQEVEAYHQSLEEEAFLLVEAAFHLVEEV
jgi:hypothetical protein